MSLTRNNHHNAKNVSHNTQSPAHRSISLSDHSDVYDHLYNVAKPIHITVYRNGDPFDAGVQIPVTRTQFKNWLTFLDYLTERLQLTDGAVHNVYTVHGEEVRHFKHLKQDGFYVGAKGEFKEAAYGGKDTRRMKWQIRNPSAKSDPTTVMSKESRELYLEQKSFKPVLDDVWDDKQFDKKNVKPMHHKLDGKHSPTKSQTIHHKTEIKHPAGNHLVQKSNSISPKIHEVKKTQAQEKQQVGKSRIHPTKSEPIPHYMTSKTNNSNAKTAPVNKKDMQDHAYRIHDQGKAPVKSRFPPIHSGSLVEMNKKTKTEKETKSVKTRSSSAPDGLQKQTQHKKTNSSESKTRTIHQKSSNKPPENKHNLKPPDGKNREASKPHKTSSRSDSPSQKSQKSNHLLNSERSRLSRSRSQNSQLSTKVKKENGHDNPATPAHHHNNKRGKSLERGREEQNLTKRQTASRRAASVDEDYRGNDRNHSYEGDDHHGYYEEEEDGVNNWRDDDDIYRNEVYDRENHRDDYYRNEHRYNDEYEYEEEPVASPNRRRYSLKEDGYQEHSSNHREPEYEHGEYNQYSENERLYEPGYEDYEKEYRRTPTPKHAGRHTKQSEEIYPFASPINSDEKNSAEGASTPRWASELTVAVRELATEVHNLSANKTTFK